MPVFIFVSPYNASLLFPFTTFIFPKFLFYHFPYSIFHIFHRLDRYSGFSFPMSFFPASPRYFFQSVPSCLPCPAVIKFFPFVASYFTRIFFARCHILISFPVLLTVSLLSFSNFLTNSYRIFAILCHLFQSCHVHQLANSKFSPCVFFIGFSFFSFHSSFPLSPNFCAVSQYSAFP